MTFGNPCNDGAKRLSVAASCSESCGLTVCKTTKTNPKDNIILKKLSPYTQSTSGCDCNGRDCACCKDGGTVCETGNQDICVEQHTEWLTGIQQEVSIVPISNIWDDEVPKWEAYNSASFTRLPNNELEVLLPNNVQGCMCNRPPSTIM